MQTIEAQVISRETIKNCGVCIHYQTGYCWYPQREDEWMPVEASDAACNVYRDQAGCGVVSGSVDEEF